MDVDLGQELLNELGSSLQDLETQLGALMQFLKDQGVVTDEKLAPYLTQAGNASSVRWRAARVRLEKVLSSAHEKEQTQQQEKAPPAPEEHGEKKVSESKEEVAVKEKDAGEKKVEERKSGETDASEGKAVEKEKVAGKDQKDVA
jgi:hypothetical protein